MLPVMNDGEQGKIVWRVVDGCAKSKKCVEKYFQLCK